MSISESVIRQNNHDQQKEDHKELIKKKPRSNKNANTATLPADQSVKHWPLKERPRERLIHCGANAISDAELLAILLRTGVKGVSVVELARRLLLESGGVRELLMLPPKQFFKLHGMGAAKYAQLQAALELGKRVLEQSIVKENCLTSSDKTKDYLRLQLRDKPYEAFVALFLDARHQLIAYKELFRGTINGASVPVREVVKEAMQYNAASLIVAHNHPSGIAEPSEADKQLTQSLRTALGLLDVNLLDHIIVGNAECCSFAERGLL
ncbi:MAG: RadC family protein [Arenicella sp.]